jgi:hypothetical protein
MILQRCCCCYNRALDLNPSTFSSIPSMENFILKIAPPPHVHHLTIHALGCCPSLLDTTGIRVPSRNVSNSSLCTVTCTNWPTARCVTAANRVCKGIDIFRKPVTSLTF